MKTNRIRRARNRIYRSNLKTVMKKVLSSSDPQEGSVHLKEAISLFDKYACKGILHKNTAARKKARLMNHVRNLGS